MTEPARPDRRVDVVEKTTLLEGFMRVDRYHLRHGRHAGGWTGLIEREVLERGHAAAVLPYDPRRDQVVLIEQFRVGAYAAGLQPWVIETIAGIIEPGESPEEVVRREAIEEAGCHLGPIEAIGRVILSPGGSSETLFLFCGLADAGTVDGIHGLEEEGEDIATLVLDAETAQEMVRSGEILAANAVIPLQWLLQNRERLRAAWG
jgi:ADP-ribose pyrophosphatase